MILKTRHTTLFALVTLVISLLLSAPGILAQATAFIYQGRLTDGGTSANGNYDLQFALWNSLSGGVQIGSTQTINTVAVSNGVFTVTLDFGASAFPGASRFLEISARPSGSGSFTLLTPRQPITSTPYAVRSLNATSADSVPASGVSAGSGNYIQNTASPQLSSNFNITGNGTAGGTLSGSTVNATTQFNLNGSHILSAPRSSLFVGVGAGAADTGPIDNLNTFVGVNAGTANTTGFANAFFGFRTGDSNTLGSDNSFFGNLAGASNTTGSLNTIFGSLANVGAGNLINATAIGAQAQVDASNSLVLGRINGINGANADTRVGIGTTTPSRLMHIRGAGSDSTGVGDLFVTGVGTVGSAITLQATGGSGRSFSWIATANGADSGPGKLAAFDVTAGAYRMVIDSSGRVGIGTTTPDQSLSVGGNASKSAGGTSWAVFSDERLKNINGPFTPGLKVLLQLQPLRYQYKPNNSLGLPGGSDEVGFSAQAVQQVLPEAVSRSQQGYLQLHSDPILWTMLNAIKEQQAQIQEQQKQMDALKKLLCQSNPQASICKGKEGAR